jgi:hypothetical protein
MAQVPYRVARGLVACPADSPAVSGMGGTRVPSCGKPIPKVRRFQPMYVATRGVAGVRAFGYYGDVTSIPCRDVLLLPNLEIPLDPHQCVYAQHSLEKLSTTTFASAH